MNGRLVRALLASILLGGAALVAVVIWIGGDELHTLGTIRPAWLAVAVLSLALSFGFAGLRLRMLVRRSGASLAWHHAVRAHVLGSFASSVTPGGSGGMPVVAMSLTRQGVPRTPAWSSVIAATAADSVLFGWSIPAALLILHRIDALPSGPAFTVASVAVSVVALAGAYLLAFRLEWMGPLGRFVLRGRLAPLAPRLDRFLGDLLGAQAALRRAPWTWHVAFHGAVAASWWCLFAVLWASARGFDLDVPLPIVVAALTLVQGVGAFVPTPGGSGFFEFGGSLALVTVGARGGVAAAVIVWRLLAHYALYLLGPMLGGYLLLRSVGSGGAAADGARQRPAATEPEGGLDR